VRDFAAFSLARLGDRRGVERTLAVMRDETRTDIRRGEAAIALAEARDGAYHGVEIGALRVDEAKPELARRLVEASRIATTRP